MPPRRSPVRRPHRQATRPPRAAPASLPPDLASALAALEARATAETLAGMARYGLPSEGAMGVAVGEIQRVARLLGQHHALAAELWQTGIFEARMLAAYVDAGCELITVHAESTVHLHRCLTQIADLGARPAVTIVPSTPISAIEHVLDLVDMVLIMTVNPGFGGQSYLASMEPKIAELRDLIVERDLDVDIEVDGGISPTTIAAATQAGANVFVSGSALFRDPEGLAHGVADLRSRAAQAQRGAHAA